MTKKRIVLLIVIVIAISSIITAMRIMHKKRQIDANNLKKQHLPDFKFFKLDGVETNGGFLRNGTSVIILYFNTDCDHCQYEAKQIGEHISAFKNSQIVMISFNTNKEIVQFAKTYCLDKIPQITFLQDKSLLFPKWFGNCSIPTLFVYNGKHELVREFYGEVKIDSILELI